MTVITVDEAQRVQCDSCGLCFSGKYDTEAQRLYAERIAFVSGWRIGNREADSMSAIFDDLCPDCAAFADSLERDELVAVEGCFDEK